MSFLALEDRTIVVFGAANKKGVGFQSARVLREAGANVVYVARNDVRAASLRKLVPEATVLALDVQDAAAVSAFPSVLTQHVEDKIHGFVHSIAFANYGEGHRPFHDVSRSDFLQAMQISCHSFVELASRLEPFLTTDASVVTISISDTQMAAENYGYMAPVKAALDSSVVFLAKSFSAKSNVRFNAVCAGPLKTRASAGIPGYVDSYLYAEKATMRKHGVQIDEIGNLVAFLLSPRSSGINAQRVVIDAGMGNNYFDASIVKAATRI